MITKLACRDESVVFFLFPILYITPYFNVWSTLLRKNRNTVFLMCVLCTLALKQKFFPWMAIVYALQSKIVACHKRRTMWMWLIVLQKEEFKVTSWNCIRSAYTAKLGSRKGKGLQHCLQACSLVWVQGKNLTAKPRPIASAQVG